jgi:uncharacterized protein (DUF169 family)
VATPAEVQAGFERYLRVDTQPLGVRLLRPGEPLPEGVRVQSEALGEHWIVCQSIGVARRYGWAVAVGRQDVVCPLAAVAFGLRRPSERLAAGEAALGMYCEDPEAAKRMEEAVWRLEPGTTDRICVAPLAKATFTPHVGVVYGNSAQIMRLVNAALFRRGGRLQSTTQGRLDCAELVIQPYLTQEPKVVLPCNGDRVFGMAQDTEVAFGFPWSLADELLEGLEATHRGGVRYPIPVAMRATPVMPERYQELLATLPED